MAMEKQKGEAMESTGIQGSRLAAAARRFEFDFKTGQALTK